MPHAMWCTIIPLHAGFLHSAADNRAYRNRGKVLSLGVFVVHVCEYILPDPVLSDIAHEVAVKLLLDEREIMAVP